MKKFLYSALLFGVALGFTACDDDNDDNPVITKPTEFQVNTPTFANQQVNLATSGDLTFTYSQPNWNFPLVVNYTLQYSLNGSFSVSVSDADADESGTLTPDYQETTAVTGSSITISSVDLAKGLQQIGQWESDAVPEVTTLYYRIKAIPAQYSITDTKDVEQYAIYCDAKQLSVRPYYVELSDAPIVMWYLVGNLFGGKWGSEIGNTALPMFIDPDYDYDKKTGTGEITYTNYMITGDYQDAKNECGTAGFKIQPSTFDWNYGFTGDNADKSGSECTKGTIIYRNGGNDGGHIVVPEDGYYKITVNTADPSAKLEKLDITPAVYDTICLSGDLNGWGDTPMLPYQNTSENHVWYYNLEVTQAMIDDNGRTDAAQIKFKIQGSWDTNWGYGSADGEINTLGVGQNGGKNIGVPVGKWLVIFNDITGEFNIVSLNE